MILFYEPLDAYGYFSNFSRHAIDLNGKRWPTTEHYFQAMKSTDRVVQERIRGARTPGQAARLGRATRLRPEWDQPLDSLKESECTPPGWFLLDGTRVIERYKDAIMFQAVYAKFTQHEDLKANLLATGDKVLVENAMADPYWGWGCSKNGLNKLGQVLMLTRERILRG
jgi:N-glycosidase YbiA